MFIKKFDDYTTFVKEVMYNRKNAKQNITIISFYEDAINILKELCTYKDVFPYSIDIHDFFWEGYDSEYYITISKEEDDMYLIYCEKAYNQEKNNYNYHESNITYILDDCSSKILKRLACDVCYEVSLFDDEDNCCYECREDKNITEKIEIDEDMKGFTISSSSDDYGFYTFSFHATDEDIVKEMLKQYKNF